MTSTNTKSQLVRQLLMSVEELQPISEKDLSKIMQPFNATKLRKTLWRMVENGLLSVDAKGRFYLVMRD